MTQFQSFEEILAALRRRMVLILLVTLLGCGLSVAFALQQQKMYEATAVVQIEEGQVSEAPSSPGVAGDDASRKVQLIEQRLMSRDNLLRIMDTHQLFTEDPAMPLNQRVSLMREAARIEEIRPAPISYQAVPQGPSGILITVRLSDAQKAADVANELMTTVIEESRSRSVIRARETLSFFESEATRVAAEMDAMTAQIAAFKLEFSGWKKFLFSAGFSEAEAHVLMPIIGWMDVLLALATLIRPVELFSAWMTAWACARTAA